jgi:hypothetical protein
MLTPRTTLTRAVAAAIDAVPSRIPVLVGGCGTGRTTLLHQIRDRVGRSMSQYVDVERCATTPERFLKAVCGSSPFAPAAEVPGARASFDAALAFFANTRGPGGEPVTFLLDEFLELRTFESFPGLRRVLHDFADGIAASNNRFVLSSRYTSRTLRLLKDRPARFEVIHVPALTAEDTLDMLDRHNDAPGSDGEFTSRAVHALTGGRARYVHALADELRQMRERGGPGADDAVSALAAQLSLDGRIARDCCSCYELRLHRARGYGALKAILDILAEDEGLTLTEISQRLRRTPGSTKDYLSWLEDVDLVVSRQKRYSFADSLLRVWVRLHCRPAPSSPEDLAREVHRYAMPRLPQTTEPALAMVTAGSPAAEEERKGWGIIEID